MAVKSGCAQQTQQNDRAGLTVRRVLVEVVDAAQLGKPRYPSPVAVENAQPGYLTQGSVQDVGMGSGVELASLFDRKPSGVREYHPHGPGPVPGRFCTYQKMDGPVVPFVCFLSVWKAVSIFEAGFQTVDLIADLVMNSSCVVGISQYGLEMVVKHVHSGQGWQADLRAARDVSLPPRSALVRVRSYQRDRSGSARSVTKL